MTEKHGGVLDRIMSVGMRERAVSAGIGAALGAVLGPAAATVTGDDKSDKNTLSRDMLAGAVGGAVGGLAAGAGGGAIGGSIGGGIAGLFDKKASTAGQDLRTPVMGGTKFPTGDSITAATRKLNQSSAEVGPQPATTYSAMGEMKKVKVAAGGDSMDPMMTDPLVLYLKKTAAKEDTPPLTGLVDSAGELKDNLPDMPLGKDEHGLTSSCPMPTTEMESKGQVGSQLQELFDSRKDSIRKKSTEKDYEYNEGVLDRVLGL